MHGRGLLRTLHTYQVDTADTQTLTLHMLWYICSSLTTSVKPSMLSTEWTERRVELQLMGFIICCAKLDIISLEGKICHIMLCAYVCVHVTL